MTTQECEICGGVHNAELHAAVRAVRASLRPGVRGTATEDPPAAARRRKPTSPGFNPPLRARLAKTEITG